MTDFAALAEAIERDRENGTPGPWDVDQHGYNDCFGDVWLRDEKRVAENIDAPDATRIARLPAVETAFLELWARVQALEGALQKIVQEDQRPRFINRHDGGAATNIAFDGRFAEIARAALQPPETDQ